MVRNFLNKIELNKTIDVLTVLFLIVFPSLTFDSLWNSAESSRLVLLGVFCCVASVAILYIKGFEFKVNIIDVFVAFIFLYLLYMNISSNSFRILDIYQLFLLLFFYAIVRNISKGQQTKILLSCLIGGIIQIFFCYSQILKISESYNSNFLISGTFFNPGPLAGYLATLLSFALIYYLKTQRMLKLSRKKITITINLICIFFIIPCLSILPLLSSRASFLTVLLTLVILFVYYSKKFLKPIQIKYIFISLVIFLLIFGGLLYIKKDSTNGRYFIINNTLTMLENSRFLGMGAGSFKKNYMLYQERFFEIFPSSDYVKVADNVYYSFNELLQITVEYGVFFTFLIILFFTIILRNSRKSNLEIKALFISIICFSLFSYTTQILTLKLLFVLSIGIMSGTSRYKEYKFKYNKNILFFTSLTFVLIIAFTTSLYSRSYLLWKKAFSSYYFEDFVTADSLYNDIPYPLSQEPELLINISKNKYFIENYEEAISCLKTVSNSLNNSLIFSTMGDCYKELGNFKSAEIYYNRSFNMVPNRIFAKYQLFQLYKEYNNTKAFLIAKQILTTNIKVRSNATKSIQEEVKEWLNSNYENPLGEMN